MDENKSSNNQIKAGAVLSYTSIIFNIVAGLIYTPWMVKQIGQSDYGIYTMVISLISYFTLDFGFGGAISRFIAKYRAENRTNEITKLLGLVYKFYFILDALIFIALLVVYALMGNIFVSLSPGELIKCKVVFAISGAFTLISFPCSPFNGILIAYERFIGLKLCDVLNKVLVVFLMGGALLLGFRLYALVVINAGVTLLLNIVKFSMVKTSFKENVDFKYFDKKLLKNIFSFSLWITVISIAQRFIMNITPSVLGITSGAIAISVFAVGRTIEGYTFTFANALNSMFLPKVSRMVANDVSREEITDLMVKIGRIQLIIVGAIITLFIAFGREFIVLWMGENFELSYIVSVLLILPSIVTLTQDIAYTLMVVENEIKYRAIIYIGAAVISVCISFVLSRYIGAVGAAIGIFTAIVLGHIIGMNWVYKNKMKLNMKKFYINCHLKACPIFFIILILGFFVQRFFPTTHMILLLIKITTVSIIYLIMMWFIYMNKEEKNIVVSIVKKIKGYINK